jgi:site-specific DNA-methyltransferase (adenine-specific)
MNKFIYGECLEKMQDIDDKSIDLILCDLPYGTTASKWDSIIDLEKMWEQYNRIIKDNSAIVLTACQPFTSKLIMSNLSNFKYEWIWDKHIPRNFINAKIMPMQKHENVVVFGKDKIKYNPQMIERDKPVTVKNYAKKNKDSAYQLNQDGSSLKSYTYTHRNPDTIIVGCWEANKGKIHPTQKPISLFEYLIKTYTNENDLVLDNCAGSFTTAIAADNLNRNWICIEKNLDYCKLGLKRINENREKLNLDKIEVDL